MPQTVPYLFFDGNCADAMRFYEKTLNGKLELMKNSDAPPGTPLPPGNENRVMHAYLTFDGGVLMASDDMAGADYKGMQGMFVSLAFSTTDEAKRVFNAFSSGGKVLMPLDKTFWTDAFGMVIDRFGTPWMISKAMAQPS